MLSLPVPNAEQYLTIRELADRWRCSRGTVYNRLRVFSVDVLDFSSNGKRGKKVVPIEAVLNIERQRLKRLA